MGRQAFIAARRVWAWHFLLVVLLAGLCGSSRAEVVARSGKGWLEHIDGYPVVHLQGSPYEMGRQHGELLKDHIRANIGHLIEEVGQQELASIGPIKLMPKTAIRAIVEVQRKFVPEKYFEELRGLADGSGVPLDDLRVANFLPELMHCSGFAVKGTATIDGSLYHGRVLDYATGWRLQEHAVLIVAEPDGGIPFVNVSYAGFIGSVTGMNAQHVSIGEMGGNGLGHWEGVPMALLMREVLEGASNLKEALDVFRNNPRTCQYYFVIADGKTNEAAGLEASWNRFEVVRPGETNELLPNPVEDCVLLSAGDRYQLLTERTKQQHGRLDAKSALRLMDRPVAMGSNLHNVLFHPASTRFWVANATADKQPAADQPYQEFCLQELLASDLVEETATSIHDDSR